MVALVLSILLIPILTELQDDKSGDIHPNYDWVVRVMLMTVFGSFCTVLRPINEYFFLSVALYAGASALFFTALFDYCMNYVHLKNHVTAYRTIGGVRIPFNLLSKREVVLHCLNHLSKTAWPDKTRLWIAIKWQGRLIVKLICLALGLFLISA
jgi:hypothetical protein